MIIFREFSDIPKDENTFLTIGTFDGIHLGHKEILSKIITKAVRNGGRSFLITFDPHPRSVLSKDSNVKILTTLDEKSILLDLLGIQNLLIIKFTREFSQISADDFVINYVLKFIGLKEIVIGHDHHFGKGRGGDENTLREMGKEFDFNVTRVDAVNINGTSVSSTKIRNALAEGNISLANSFLGRYYSFHGNVVKGDGRGRLLGFPTANIKLKEENKLLPAIGIYAVELSVDNVKHFGLMSIGKRPTFYNDGQLTTEIYIFDFDKNIYDKNVIVKVVERIRGEEKYSSPEELVAQMKKDKEAGMEIMSRLTN